MLGILGSQVDELDKDTIKGMGIGVYYEAMKIQALYREMADLVPYSGDAKVHNLR